MIVEMEVGGVGENTHIDGIDTRLAGGLADVAQASIVRGQVAVLADGPETGDVDVECERYVSVSNNV